MELKQQLKHFLNIGIGTIFNIILGLITTPIITRLVTTSDYGALSMFNTYASMAVMVLCLGLDQSLVRFYYECKLQVHKKELIFKTVGVSFTLCIVVCFISYFVLNSDEVTFDFKGISLIMLLLYICVQLLQRFSQLILRVEYETKLYASLVVLNKVLYLLLAVSMIINTSSSSNLFLLMLATVISIIPSVLIGMYKERRLWFGQICKNSVNKFKVKEIALYGFPFILSMGITTLFEALDKLTLNYYCDYSEVGIYSSAITIVNIFTIIQTTFNTLWSPMAIEHYTNNSKDVSFFKKMNNTITVILFLFGISLIAFKDIFILLLGENYRQASTIIPFLVFHPIMYTISETTAIGIDFKKKSYLHIIVAAGACVTNAVGNILLVPILGGRGAAISTGISYIIFFIMRSFFGIRNYNYDPYIFKIIILTVLTIAYASYSTFVNRLSGIIIIYIIIILIIVALYKDTIINIYIKINYIINNRL